MSRKDFLSRALQVPKFEGGPVAAPTQTPAVAPLTQPAPVQKSSTTAPSAMLNFMREQSDAHKDLEEARGRLAEFDDAVVARHVDAKQIEPSPFANRNDASYLSPAFATLKEEISSAGGNVQPIKVRRTSEGRLQIVFGHRRHRACLELGLPVLALVVDELDDQTLFIEMERENRGRADLSAWEQGMHYQRALDSGLFPSLRQLAARLGVDLSQVSRAIVMAKLPEDVVRAFASPLDLQFRWANVLRDAVQKDPEKVLQRAREIAALPKRPAAAEVLRLLTTDAPKHGPVGREWTDSAGKTAAKLEFDGKGRVRVTFAKPMSESALKKLAGAIDGILG